MLLSFSLFCFLFWGYVGAVCIQAVPSTNRQYWRWPFGPPFGLGKAWNELKIAETYSFLPREAVTRFLMSCTDCQKRMHLTLEGNNNNTSSAANQNEAMLSAAPMRATLSLSPVPRHVTPAPPILDLSVPITQTILNHMRSKGYVSDYSYHDESRDSDQRF
ncbi:hypothetical protein ACOMHN_011633 [Nucella lapillus]